MSGRRGDQMSGRGGACKNECQAKRAFTDIPNLATCDFEQGRERAKQEQEIRAVPEEESQVVSAPRPNGPTGIRSWIIVRKLVRAGPIPQVECEHRRPKQRGNGKRCHRKREFSWL